MGFKEILSFMAAEDKLVNEDDMLDDALKIQQLIDSNPGEHFTVGEICARLDLKMIRVQQILKSSNIDVMVHYKTKRIIYIKSHISGVQTHIPHDRLPFGGLPTKTDPKKDLGAQARADFYLNMRRGNRVKRFKIRKKF